MSISFKIASTKEEMNLVYLLRKQVFVEEQEIPLGLDSDGKDEISTHLLTLDENQAVIGTGRLTIIDKEGIVARIAVLSAWRGKGIGKQIINELEKIAQKSDAKWLTLKPHYYLESFYQQLGFYKVEGEEMVGKHQLITMRKNMG